jgi:glycosyltransferase involved in cell wall biosynthesis
MIVTNSLTGGGAERSMNLAANELIRRGWPVALVPINSSAPDQVAPECEVFPIERQWKGSLVGTLVALRKFSKIVKYWNPEIIILNCDLPELFGATLFSKRKFVVIEHADRPWITRIFLGRVTRKLLEIRNTKWVAVSNHFAIWPGMRIPDAVLPNAIRDMNMLRQSTSQILPVNALQRLVFIGRLAPQKRPDWLISISEKTNIPVEIIGEGVMQKGMEELAKDKNLQVNFRGRIQMPWGEIKEGDLLIVPSGYEGDGLVVVEGLQQKVPMLLSDIPDFRRFNLPDRNYCKSVEDFVASINAYTQILSTLVIPNEISDAILASRSLKVIGDNWEKFLESN